MPTQQDRARSFGAWGRKAQGRRPRSFNFYSSNFYLMNPTPTRRSMSEALQVTPEAIAIIEQGRPKSQAQNPILPVTVDSSKVQPATLSKETSEAQRLAKPKFDKGREVEAMGLVSVNFRLPSNIPPALLKASSDRKIKKLHPFTQQDIV